jgi:ribosome maturation factor RimP
VAPRLEVGFAAHLFSYLMQTDPLTIDIEQRLSGLEPDVELLACEKVGADRLRLFIDHPDGVSLGLCERVTHHLRELLIDYSLEVSSPGPQRPLTKPDHFRRFLGRRARVRLREPRDGHKSFTGELVGASDEEITVAAGEGIVSIPYSDINRSNLMPEAAGPAAPSGQIEGEG